MNASQSFRDLTAQKIFLAVRQFRERRAGTTEIKAQLTQHFLFPLHYTDPAKRFDDAVAFLLNGISLVDSALLPESVQLHIFLRHEVISTSDAAVRSHNKTGQEHFIKPVEHQTIREPCFELLQREEIV